MADPNLPSWREPNALFLFDQGKSFEPNLRDTLAMQNLRKIFSFPGTTKKASSPFMYTSHASLFGSGNYSGLSAKGYAHNVIAHRSISLIARSISAVPLMLYANQERLDTHPILELLKNPNPTQGQAAFFEAVLSFLLISGNSYIEALKGPSGTPAELYALRPDRIKIIPGPKGLPKHYEYQVGGQKRHIFVDPLSGQSALLHMRYFNATDDWYGLSPLSVAEQAINCHTTVSSHNLALLQNGGRPSGALCLKDNGGKPLSEEQKQELRESLQEIYQGSKKAGQMMLLEGGFDWKEMGLSPKDMDFNEGKNVAAREIAQTFGVPPMLVGIPGDSTFSNYKEARLHMWEDTLLPLLSRVLDHLNTWLIPLFQEDLRLTYDPEAIPCLTARRESVWERLNSCTFLTQNEKRSALGYGPVDGGDHLPQNNTQST